MWGVREWEEGSSVRGNFGKGGVFGVLRCCGMLLLLLLVHIARGGLEITVALTGLQLDSHFLYAT